MMNKLQKQVLLFHDTFDIKVEETPTYPDKATALLRCKLIEEEATELFDSLGYSIETDGTRHINMGDWNSVDNFHRGDLVEVADALGDLLYVIYGAALSFGIDLEPVTDEIHRSNMSKVGGHKREDGKWIKPDTYSPADIKSVLEKQGWTE